MSNFNDQYAFSSSGLNEATLKNALVKLSPEYQVKTSYVNANIPVPLQNLNLYSFNIVDCPLIISDGSYLRMDVDYYLGTAKILQSDGSTPVADSENTYTIAPGEGILYPMNYPRSSSNLIQRSSMQINSMTYNNENDTGVHSDISYLYQSMDYFKSTFNQHWNVYTPTELGGPSVLLSQNKAINANSSILPYIHLEEKDYLWINKTGSPITIDTTYTVPTNGSDIPNLSKPFKITKTFIIPYKYINDVFTTPMINVYSTNNPILTLTVAFVDKLRDMLTIPIVYQTTGANKYKGVYYAMPWITHMGCYTKTIINYVDNKSAAKALSRFKIDNTYVLPYYSWRLMTNGYQNKTLGPETSWTYSPTDTAMIYNVISLGMVIKQQITGLSNDIMNQYRSDNTGDANTKYIATEYDNGFYPVLNMVDISNFNILITANNIQLNLKGNIDKVDIIQQNTYATGYFWDEDNGLNYGKISLYQFENGQAFILFNFADIFNTFYKSGLMISPSSTLKLQCTFKNTKPRAGQVASDSVTLDVRTYLFYKQYYTCDEAGITGQEQLNMAVEAERLQDLEQ